MKYLITFFYIISLIEFIVANDVINHEECELCDMIVYRINILNKNNKIDEIPHMLAKFCFRTNNNYRSNCETISEQYIEIVELLENNTNINIICDKLDFCNIINNDIIEENIICNFIYSSILNDLFFENTEEFVEKTCKKFSIKFIPICENMFISYLEYFKDSIKNNKNSINTCLDIYYSIYFNINLEEYIDYENLHEL
jgi:hypothetical protein